VTVFVGGIERLTYQVFNEALAPVDPSTIELHVFLPNGTEVTPPLVVSPTGSPTGNFKYDYPTTTVGRMTGYWLTTNPKTLRGFTFEVLPTDSQNIVSIDDMKVYLNKDVTLHTDDDELYEMLRVSTEIINDRAGTTARTTIVDERKPNGMSLWLSNPPVIQVLSIVPYLYYGAIVPVNFTTLEKDSGRVERLDAFGFFDGPYKVTYIAGREIMPASLTHASKEIVRHLWETQRGGLAQNIVPYDPQDEEMFVVSGREYTVPRRVLELIQPESRGPRVA
jgi:hypothetical protein